MWVHPDGWARGEREGYGGPRDVTSLSLRGEGLSVMSFQILDTSLTQFRAPGPATRGGTSPARLLLQPPLLVPARRRKLRATLEAPGRRERIKILCQVLAFPLRELVNVAEVLAAALAESKGVARRNVPPDRTDAVTADVPRLIRDRNAVHVRRGQSPFVFAATHRAVFPGIPLLGTDDRIPPEV